MQNNTWIPDPSLTLRQVQAAAQFPAAPTMALQKQALTLLLGASLLSSHQKIRVNAVAPGAIPTEVMLKAVGKDETELDQLLQEWNIPLGRLGTPEDIASVCIYLASDAASWVSGEIIRVGGGAKPR